MEQHPQYEETIRQVKAAGFEVRDFQIKNIPKSLRVEWASCPFL
jgi:hypothetical protein